MDQNSVLLLATKSKMKSQVGKTKAK